MAILKSMTMFAAKLKTSFQEQGKFLLDFGEI